MNKPDWTKAPEGATHWDSEFDVFCDKNGFWDGRNQYYRLGNYCWSKSKYIPRPEFVWGVDLPPVGTKCLVRREIGVFECEIFDHTTINDKRVGLYKTDKGRIGFNEAKYFEPEKSKEEIEK
jgi:hypothetical protein